MATNNAINLSDSGIPVYDGSGIFSATTTTQYNILAGDANNKIFNIAPGTAGIPLISNGISSNPTFGTALIEGGGTGSTSFLTNGVIISGITNTSPLAAVTLTNGQIIIGNTSGAPAAANLTAGTGVSITNGANSITIATKAGGYNWNNITSASQTIVSGNGYISNNSGATVTYTLTASPSLGDSIIIAGGNNSSATAPWLVALGSVTQKFHFGNAVITTGTGTLAATQRFDTIQLVCIVGGSNAEWLVINSIGNIIYT